MYIRKYPFSDSLSSSKNPLLPIQIINPANDIFINTWALIDTGASVTAIPGFIAQKLYHRNNNPKVEKVNNFGLSGEDEGYLHTFSIKIFRMNSKGITNYNKVVHELPTKTYPVYINLHTVLLGEEDFLNNFIININYPNKTFSIKSPLKVYGCFRHKRTLNQ